MKKISIAAALCISALAIPVSAGAHGKPEHPGKSETKSHKCKPHKVAFTASGTLAAPATLTQTKGADTPNDTSDDRYSGTLSVNVTKTNHHAAGGTNPQSFTVSDIRLGDGVVNPAPAGTKVKLIGKVTKVAKKCTDQSGAGVVTIRKAVLKAPATT